MACGRGVGVDVAVACRFGVLPQRAVEPYFLVVEERQVPLGDAQGVRARIACAGEQVRVADNVDAGVRRPVPDLGQHAGQVACGCVDLLLYLVGAAGGVVSLAGRDVGRDAAGDQGGDQVEFRAPGDDRGPVDVVAADAERDQ